MRKQRKLSEETKAKLRAAKLGTKHTEEEKKKISESMKKYWAQIPYEANEEDNNLN